MDILERSIAMFVVYAAVEIGRNIYKGYVKERPELSETSDQRKMRKEAERIEAALRYGLESGRLSRDEFDRLYAERVLVKYADCLPITENGAIQSER